MKGTTVKGTQCRESTDLLLLFSFFLHSFEIFFKNYFFSSDLFHINFELISFFFQKAVQSSHGEKRGHEKIAFWIAFGIIVKIAKGSKLERKGSGKLCSKSVASMAQFFDQLSINIVICHSSESREREKELWDAR